jgi:hypothetical protein
LALGKSAVELVVVNVLTLTLAASTGAMWWAFHKRRATRATDGPHADSPAEA